MKQAFENTSVFILTYIALASLTYVLPYAGSNSILLNALTFAFSPFLWMHLAASIGLIVIVSMRGNVIRSETLVIFPVLALIFDFAPLLNLIPLVPTVMHVLAISVGAQAASRRA